MLLGALGLSQNQFAQKLGVSQANFNQIINGKRPFGKNMQRRVISEFGVSSDWLLTGEGPMLRDMQEVSILTTPVPSVPLYSLESVAGFAEDKDQSQYVEKEIPWAEAKDGDFAVHVAGNSMEPRIPNGSMVLVRPYNYTDYTDLEFGRVHIVVTNDNRAMIKVVKLDTGQPRHVLLISFNPDYPPRSIPVSSVRRVFLAVAVQAPL